MITWTKKLHPAGGSLQVVLPIEILKALGIGADSLVTMGLKQGKFGPYLALWKETKVKEDK